MTPPTIYKRASKRRTPLWWAVRVAIALVLAGAGILIGTAVRGSSPSAIPVGSPATGRVQTPSTVGTTTTNPPATTPTTDASSTTGPFPEGRAVYSYGSQQGEAVATVVTKVGPLTGGGVSLMISITNRGTAYFTEAIAQIGVIDASGTYYSASPSAEAAALIDSDVLGPGATVTGTVTIPMPFGDTPSVVIFSPWGINTDGQHRLPEPRWIIGK